MLAYFEYFVSYPQSQLIRAQEAKIAKENLAVYFIRGISAKDIFVYNVFAEAIFI